MCRVHSAPHRVMHTEDRVWKRILWKLHQQNKQLILSLPIEGPVQFKKPLCFFPTYRNMCLDRNLVMAEAVSR